MTKPWATINNKSAQRKVFEAARIMLAGRCHSNKIQLSFLNGRWLVSLPDETQYVVFDAAGKSSLNGFEFRQLAGSPYDPNLTDKSISSMQGGQQ